MALTILEGIIMNLVETIEKETKYKPDKVEQRIIISIQMGSEVYRNVWSNYCNPSTHDVDNPRLLYSDVVDGLYWEAKKDLEKTHKRIKIIGRVTAAMFAFGLLSLNAKIMGASLPLFGHSIFDHWYTHSCANKYEQALRNYDKKILLDSIENIKDHAGPVILNYLGTN